ETTQIPSSRQSDSDADLPSIGRYRELSQRWRAVMAILTALSTLLAVNQIFNLGFLSDTVMLDSRYLYLITGFMLAMVFITFPSHSKNLNHVPWYDLVIIGLITVIFGYYAWFAERIVLEAWEYAAPPIGVALA